VINIFQPDIKKESLELLSEVFESNWLGRGELATRFEKEISEFLNLDEKRFHTVASCTDAIFAVLKVFNFPKGSKVIIPSISFPAVPSAIIEAGLTPVVVDVSIDSGNICLDSLMDNYSSDCAAVFLLEYGGIPIDIDAVKKIVGTNCRILLDAAGSLGTFVNGSSSAVKADFTCWSFDAMKMVVCGEGGGVYFKDTKMLENFKEYCYLGLPSSSKSGIDRATTVGPWWEYQLNCAGRRSVFTNINAAIGLPQLPHIHEKFERRHVIRSSYVEAFQNISGLSILDQPPSSTHIIKYSNYFFTILLEDRNSLAAFLKGRDIYSTFRYYPIHKIDLFKGYAVACQNADFLCNHALNLPIHNSLTDENVDYIISSVINFFKK